MKGVDLFVCCAPNSKCHWNSRDKLGLWMSERNRGNVNKCECFRRWGLESRYRRGVWYTAMMKLELRKVMQSQKWWLAPSLAPSSSSLFTSVKGNLWYLKWNQALPRLSKQKESQLQTQVPRCLCRESQHCRSPYMSFVNIVFRFVHYNQPKLFWECFQLSPGCACSTLGFLAVSLYLPPFPVP